MAVPVAHRPMTFGSETLTSLFRRRGQLFALGSKESRGVLKGASVAFVINISGAGSNFLLAAAVSWLLGAAGAGAFFLSLTVAQAAGVFARLGLDLALLRFVAAGAATGDWASVRGVYSRGVTVGSSAAVVAALSVWALSRSLALSVFSNPTLESSLRLVAFAIPASVVAQLHAEALKGVGKIALSQWLQGPSIPFVTFLGVILLHGRLGTNGAVLAAVGATVITAGTGFIAWRVSTPFLLGVHGHFDLQRLLRSSLPLFWASSLNLAIGWVSTLQLGALGSSHDVGVFSIVSRTAMVTSLVLISLNSIAAPRFAALYHRGELSTLADTARFTTLIVTSVTAPIFAIFMVAPAWVLHFFGPDFTSGARALVVMAAAQLVNVATGSVGYLLIVSGNERVFRNTTALATALTVLLNAWLIPGHGLLGAAIATAIGVATVNIANAIQVRRRLGFFTIPLFGSKVLPAFPHDRSS